MARRTSVIIDLSALRHNIRAIRQSPGGQQPMLAVVKAEAYGHGAIAVSWACQEEGVEFLGVALVAEAAKLRSAGISKNILVMAGDSDGDLQLAIDLNIQLTAHDLLSLDRLLKIPQLAPKLHLKIDTGMSRLGILPSEVPQAIAMFRAAGVRPLGLSSHLALADSPTDAFTPHQVERFRECAVQFRQAGMMPMWIHMANSAAVSRMAIDFCNLTRPGLLLYGYPANPAGVELSLQKMMRWEAEIIQVKRIPAHTGVSYGHRFVTTRETTIAVAAVGYADGLPRLTSNRGHMLVHGRRAPILGSVCMDLTVLDVSHIPECRPGDIAVVMGRDGALELSAADIAVWADTLPYEIICGVGIRVPRIYVDSATGRRSNPG